MLVTRQPVVVVRPDVAPLIPVVSLPLPDQDFARRLDANRCGEAIACFKSTRTEQLTRAKLQDWFQPFGAKRIFRFIKGLGNHNSGGLDGDESQTSNNTGNEEKCNEGARH